MKKINNTKLAVRRETLRALSDIDLTRVAGGEAATRITDTCAAVCGSSVDGANAIITPPRD